MQVQEILKLVNYPIDYLVIDFETYADKDYSFKNLSTVEYVMDARFDFLGCGFSKNGCGCYFITKDYLRKEIDGLQTHYGQNLERATVIIQNAKFDALVLQEKFNIKPPYIIDILDLARYYDSRMKHGLADLAKMFKLKPKGDTKQFMGLHYEDMTDEQKKALAEYCNTDIEIENDLFNILLPLLSNPEIEIPLARHTLGMYLNPRVRLNFDKAKVLVKKMEQEAEKMISVTGHTKKEISGNISFLKILKNALPTGENVTMKPGKKKLIPAFAKQDEGMKNLLIHGDEKIRNLASARLSVRSWPLHIKRVNNMVNQAKAKKGWLGVPLKYYGSHTGRFSGGEKINVQNFGKRGRTGSGINPLIKEVAKLIEAPEGYTFITPDLSQIEARVLAWLAGQNDLLDSFAHGDDVYSEFATTLFNSKVYEPDKDEPKPLSDLLNIRRGFGKDSILGCGYGMGAVTFYLNCLENTGLRPLFKEPVTFDRKRLKKIMRQHAKVIKCAGIENYVLPKAGEFDEKFIAYLILKYRKTYPRIPEFWTFCEKAFRWVTKYPSEVTSWYLTDDNSCVHKHIGNAKVHLKNSLLTFYNDNGTVIIQLPSGRELRYRHARFTPDSRNKGYIDYRWGALWGGTLTENIVQAISRDILAEAILKIDPFNPIVCHVHDSISIMIKEDNVRFAKPKIERTMCTNPEWAVGLPIGVKTKVKETF